jgi:hypothetical protein
MQWAKDDASFVVACNLQVTPKQFTSREVNA